MRLCVVAVLVLGGGCSLYFGDGAASQQPDARPPDAPTQPPYMPPTYCQLGYIQSTFRCTGSMASTLITNYYQGAGTHSMCSSIVQQSAAQCAGGCGVDSQFTHAGAAAFEDIYTYGLKADVLCAETPVAHTGDACNRTGAKPCLPTRVQLNTDGTVAGQDYLTCDSTTNRCVAAQPPTFTGYLQPCDSTTLPMYGTPGVNGNAGACLLAWDDSTQSITSGTTRGCMGDWECPAGALCDDQLTPVDGSTKTALCKPGPRGVLTPAMLSH